MGRTSPGEQGISPLFSLPETEGINKETQSRQAVINLVFQQLTMTQIDPRLVAAIVQALRQYGWGVTSPTQNAGEITSDMTWNLAI
jgi:HD-GYP domain-containing protein (c-di-GMP phosphodiesterase class II)